jgi:FkbM family methyltransferase
MKDLAKKAVVNTLWGLMGRRNLVRFARTLSQEARFDAGNEIASNGERLVQAVAIEATPRERAPIILDVGANVGDWTRSLLDGSIASALRGDVRVFSFEPCQATFELLRRNLSSHALAKCVTPVQKALSDRCGSATLNVVGDGAGTNSLHEYVGRSTPRQETITLTTADEFCREHAIGHIALLKSDTEGHDMAVLTGAKGLLARRAIDMLQFEYNQRWIFSRHYLLDAFELLVPFGYRIGKITARGIEFYRAWDYELESWREANFLACREDWCEKFPRVKWWNE